MKKPNPLKFLNNKRGVVYSSIVWILRIIFIVFALVAVVILVRLYVSNSFAIDPLISDIFVNSLLYSPGGISYHDPFSGRVYPGVIDVDQFQHLDLENSLNLGDNRLIAAEITVDVFVPENPAINGERVIYYNKEWYDNWLPLAKSMIPGMAGADFHERKLPVIVQSKKFGMFKADLNVKMIIPRG